MENGRIALESNIEPQGVASSKWRDRESQMQVDVSLGLVLRCPRSIVSAALH
jgi:hypothetical protein